MLIRNCRLGHRLVGRLERGVALTQALRELCQAHDIRSAEVRGFGGYLSAELAERDIAADGFVRPRRFTTPGTVIQLLGQISHHAGELLVQATCTLAYRSDNGIVVVGGYLTHAELHQFEFVLESFDDVAEAAAVASAPAVPPVRPVVVTSALARSGAPPVSPPPTENAWASPRQHHVEADEPAPRDDRDATAPAGVTTDWQAVISASARLETADRAPATPQPVEEPLHAGDVIDHPRFGRCSVERVEGDQEYAQVRLANNRLVRLSLDVLHLIRDGNDGERRRFRVRGAGR